MDVNRPSQFCLLYCITDYENFSTCICIKDKIDCFEIVLKCLPTFIFTTYLILKHAPNSQGIIMKFYCCLSLSIECVAYVNYEAHIFVGLEILMKFIDNAFWLEICYFVNCVCAENDFSCRNFGVSLLKGEKNCLVFDTNTQHNIFVNRYRDRSFLISQKVSFFILLNFTFYIGSLKEQPFNWPHFVSSRQGCLVILMDELQWRTKLLRSCFLGDISSWDPPAPIAMLEADGNITDELIIYYFTY